MNPEIASAAGDGPLVNYRLIRLHLLAAILCLLLSMTGGFLYSLQFI